MDWQEFTTNWKNASTQEKKQMIDVSFLYENFKSKDENYVITIFGSPSFKGQNNFGQYEVRYDFDSVPKTEGRRKQYLSFIIEKDVVVRVEAFILPE